MFVCGDLHYIQLGNLAWISILVCLGSSPYLYISLLVLFDDVVIIALAQCNRALMKVCDCSFQPHT